MAPSTIEDCFYSVITARQIAETLQYGRRRPVRREPRDVAAAVPAAGVQRELARAADRPERRCPRRESRTTGTRPPGLHRRFVPGSRAACTRSPALRTTPSHVAYDPEINEEGLRARSLKLAALQKTLKTPPIFGDARGRPAGHRLGQHQGRDRGSGRAPARRGHESRRCTCTFLQPMPPGIKEVMQRFKQGDDDRGQLERPPEDELIDETTAAIRRSRCCCARATWSTSTAGAKCAASRSSRARSRRVLRAKLQQREGKRAA